MGFPASGSFPVLPLSVALPAACTSLGRCFKTPGQKRPSIPYPSCATSLCVHPCFPGAFNCNRNTPLPSFLTWKMCIIGTESHQFGPPTSPQSTRHRPDMSSHQGKCCEYGPDASQKETVLCPGRPTSKLTCTDSGARLFLC